MKNYQVTEWCRHFIKEQIKPGDLCIDATAGNGHDAVFMAALAGVSGQVLAFDIQEQALENTAALAAKEHVEPQVRVIRDSHVNMDLYAEPGSISCITFNFGYLPGGDHSIATRPDTSVEAVKKGLQLLQKGGLMSLCIYSGGDSGFAERDVLLEFLESLDSKVYLVILSRYYNRPGHPPIPVLIIRL